MKEILITGTAGFIGFHLAKSLLNQKIIVIGVDNHNSYYDVKIKKDRVKILKKNQNYKHFKLDLLNKEKLSKIFSLHKPSVVVHLAAQAGVRYSFSNPKAYIDSNLIGFHNIIESSKEFNIKHFIYASSSSVGQSIFLKVSNKQIVFMQARKSNELSAHVYSNI